MSVIDHDNKYANKFYKKMSPGRAFGNGFVGEAEHQLREKPKKLWVTVSDLTRR